MLALRDAPRVSGTTLLILLGLCLASTTSATPVTQGFEGLAAGMIVVGPDPKGDIIPGNLYPGFSLLVTANALATSSLCVFDTAHPSAVDFDLGTPNYYFGGPGIGLGGEPGMPGENKIAQGKALVISENLTDIDEDGLVDAPDDNHSGGEITLLWDDPSILSSMTFVDIEEVGATIDCYRGNKLIQSFPVPAFGDNSQVTVKALTSRRIDRTVITFPGSGALAAMTYEPIELTCDIGGDQSSCVGSTRTYTTTASELFDRQWWITSSPAGIASIVGSTTGSSVEVSFNAPGIVTVHLTVSDPEDTSEPPAECSVNVAVRDLPPCNIEGDAVTCVGATRTYSTSVTATYGRIWSVSSNPENIASIVGSSTGSAVQVSFTAPGTATLQLEVTDPQDPERCHNTCTREITINPQPSCDIRGPATTCVGATRTFSTSIGAAFTRQWSVTSTPPGIAAISGPSTGGSVQVNFTGPGTATVTLDVSDPSYPEACHSQCTQNVTINAQPSCDVNGDATACVGATKTYSTTVGSGYTRNWSVTSVPTGIAAISGPSTGGSVQVNFTGPGTVTVKLEVSDPNAPDDCHSTCSKEVTVSPQPGCDISGDRTACAGVTKTYSTTVGSEYTRQWSVTSVPTGIAAISGPSTGGSVQVNFTGPGTVTVHLDVSDPAHPKECHSTCTWDVTVSPQPSCDVSGDATACVGALKTYTTTVGAAYTRQWSVSSVPPGIAAISGPSTGGSVQVNFTGPGTVTVKLEVSDPNHPEECHSTCDISVAVGSQPSCDISGEGTACVGITRTYTTTVGAGYSRQWSVSSVPPGIAAIVGSLTGASVQVSFTGAGTVTVALQVTDPAHPNDCHSRCTKDVIVNAQPGCDISGEATACAGTTETYSTTVGPGYTRQWSISTSPANRASIVGPSTGGSIQVSFTDNCTATITLEVSAPSASPTDPKDPAACPPPPTCTSTCTFKVTVNEGPSLTIDGPDEICARDDDLTFTATSNKTGTTFSWSISGNGTIVGPTNGSSVSVTAGAPGSFTLTVTGTKHGCSNSKSLTRTVYDCETPTCWLTGGGCLIEGEGRGHKDHTFGGNVGPQPSGSWEHIKRDGNNILFNFHSWDAKTDSCRSLPGCDGKTPAAPNSIWFSGTGRFSDAYGHNDVAATFRAHAEDWGEGGGNQNVSGADLSPACCVDEDSYWIKVYNQAGALIFQASGDLTCGNMQIHRSKPETTPSAPPPDDTTPGTVPAVTMLETRAFPNPVRTSTTSIYYFVPPDAGAARVDLTIYDLSGRLLRTLVSAEAVAGPHTEDWDLRDEGGTAVPSGIYFYRLTVGSKTVTQKMMVLRQQ